MHLGVNSLSLMVPLIAVHALGGRQYFADRASKPRLTWAEIVKFDAAYYAGVVGMVGFWLALGHGGHAACKLGAVRGVLSAAGPV